MRWIKTDTVVIGTGCAGFNAADSLHSLGKTDLVMVTEGVSMGTSRNTGSDKQTYYKLSVSGDQADSVQEMAETLFSGGGVMGDIALCEAAGSLQGFYRLVQLGVPFPTNEFGEYAGYKTDHDPRQRATSAGPLTSKFMTEALERSVRDKGIPIHDHTLALRILTDGGRVCGLLAMDTLGGGMVCYRCGQIIAATGGPAIVYRNSVFPESQSGMTGMLLQSGARGRNLNEWQYGLASVKFRWNVSGTYQQVLPRYIAVDGRGTERELFPDYFADPFAAADMAFLKGYQWPFDVGRVTGSSQIDLIVHHVTSVLKQRVYMDFTRNPSCIDAHGFSALGREAHEYLKNSDALFGTPVERLRHMNPGAVTLYADHGIDLAKEPLEVAVCAQHMNGGIAVNCHWESGVRGLYVCGEAAGTFGPYRPGGSALNATQVGSRRAAEAIALGAQAVQTLSDERLNALALEAVQALPQPAIGSESNLNEKIVWAQQRMSRCAAHVRDEKEMAVLSSQIASLLEEDGVRLKHRAELPLYYRYRDMLVTQQAMLSAMQTAAQTIGSRGSALVLDTDGRQACGALPGCRMRAATPLTDNCALITRRAELGFTSEWEPVTPIPARDQWFENVWRGYRERTSKA